MENKKSFLLHLDSLDILEELSDAQAGQLFKAILAFQKGNTVQLDQVVKMAFIPFRNQFLRDNEKWIDTKNKRVIAGAKGGKQKVANDSKQWQTTPVNENVNVSVSVNENENINGNEKESENVRDSLSPPSSFSFKQFWDLYNKKTGLIRCKQAWEELTEEDKQLIKERLPAYIKATDSEILFRKDPYTWLMGKHWLDEHVPAMAKKSAYDLI